MIEDFEPFEVYVQNIFDKTDARGYILPQDCCRPSHSRRERGFVLKTRYETFKRDLVETPETLLRQDPLKRALSTEKLRDACNIPVDESPLHQALD